MFKLPKRFLTPLIVIVSLGVGFAGGLVYSHEKDQQTATIQQLVNTDSGNVQNVDFSLFWKVWNNLESQYVDKSKLDVQKMVYGAIEGMVNSIGDPYTVFFEPSQNQAFQQEISGSFGGVGMEIDVKNNILTVVAPLPNTPAAQAGIQTGDKILDINGTSTQGLSADEAVSDIRGKNGTKVTVTIQTGDNKPRDITLTRTTINVPTVVWKMLDDNGKHIAYIQAYEFNSNIDPQFKTAIQQIEKSNADAIVLDLRGNPGGLLDSAVDLAGYWVNKGQLVVSEVFGDGSKNDYNSNGTAELDKYPTVILVNGGTASAAEILSGALHDQIHIKLIGEKTFGKGVVQELDNLDNGSSLKVTVARWFTPAGVNIQKQGITPDINVPLSKDQQNNIIVGDPTKDPQLQKALDTVSK